MSQPRYRQIEAAVKERIISGTYPPGSQVPTEKALAAEFSVSLITSKRALTELADQGLIVRRRGAGSFVRQTATGHPRSAATLKTERTTYYIDAQIPLLLTDIQQLALPLTRIHQLNEALPTSGPVVMVGPVPATEKIYSLTNKDIPFLVGSTAAQSLPFPQVSFANDAAATLTKQAIQMRGPGQSLPLFYDDDGTAPYSDQLSAQARYISFSQTFTDLQPMPQTTSDGIFVFNELERLQLFLAKEKHADIQRVAYFFLITYLPLQLAKQLQRYLVNAGVQVINFDWQALLSAATTWPGTMQPWQKTVPPRFVTV
ncbi:MAG: GntR family transcriptional regulator [Schleiferilactobacillus harbinensis]|jgi:DNA-binding transcriptional regulator YhcF (GntR family)|nr:GntR family transcriptional regulator [Schleiferilactobacillus harbinensis]MCI1912475.1 GntR family transcriptional regulator [Schleiferilactobacillus harbinensis]